MKNIFFDNLSIYIAQYSPYIFILVEILLFFIFKFKNEALYAFYSMMLALSINKIISIFYFHNRPFMDNIAMVLHEHKADNSFPSDHTTFMFAIAFSLLFFSNTNKLAKYLLIFSLIGGISRIYIGVHYPYDIAGAIIVSFLSAYIILNKKVKLLGINKLLIGSKLLNIFNNSK
jgi:undecaprenyl-diphosphatase